MSLNEYADDNVFAKIIRGEIPSAKIFETDRMLAIMDVMPQSLGHCLLIPKAPSRNLLDATEKTLAEALPAARRLASAAVRAFEADGVVVSQFNEEPAGQTVFHLHFHIIPRYRDVPLEKHAGRMADPSVLAEQAAKIRLALGEDG